ncbi:MAG: thioredoxin-disulfide reductase [Thermodesulfobacteriota bacterium]
MTERVLDLVIIGGGPAGLTAGLYGARARLELVLLEKVGVGGQVLVTEWVDNYPGFPDGIAGPDLVERMRAQAERFGLAIRQAEVEGLDLTGPQPQIRLAEAETLACRSLIIASGARPTALGVPGEAELRGRGVSYCATCDGPFFRDREIVVVGGGDTAVQEAHFLTRFARRVTVVHRRDSLRAAKVLQERAVANDKIAFCWNSRVIRILGSTEVEGVELEAIPSGQRSILPADGVFVFIGIRPNNEFLPSGALAVDPWGFLITDAEMQTSVPGVFAAGDIRSKNVRQISTAVGEAAVAALAAEGHALARSVSPKTP